MKRHCKVFASEHWIVLGKEFANSPMCHIDENCPDENWDCMKNCAKKTAQERPCLKEYYNN